MIKYLSIGAVAVLIVGGGTFYFLQQRSTSVNSTESGTPISGSVTFAHPALIDTELKNRSFIFQYSTHPTCDSQTTTDTFTLSTGDGRTYQADCRGVVEHTYETAGVYTVRYLHNGVEIAKTEVTIESQPSGFNVSPLSGPAPLTISLTDRGNVTGINFGDGTQCSDMAPGEPVLKCRVDGALQQHTYTQPGTYTLIATGSTPSRRIAEITIVVR
jgi:PKD repeat protein